MGILPLWNIRQSMMCHAGNMARRLCSTEMFALFLSDRRLLVAKKFSPAASFRWHILLASACFCGAKIVCIEITPSYRMQLAATILARLALFHTARTFLRRIDCCRGVICFRPVICPVREGPSATTQPCSRLVPVYLAVNFCLTFCR